MSPYEVEEVLNLHPDVHIALVFGIPNELKGEITGEPALKLDPNPLTRTLSPRLPGSQVPL